MTIKGKIARFLIVLGFIINLTYYMVDLVCFYQGELSSMVLSLEDSEEKSESKETDSSEKEDSKEKDKILQYADGKYKQTTSLIITDFPEVYYKKSTIFLEFTTPPPEYC